MNDSNRQYDEKRDFIRMKIETPAEIELMSENKKLKGICRDLSGGGMRVELDAALPMGAEVEATVISEHGHNPMLMAKAKVTRVEAQSANQYSIGFEITELLNQHG